MPESRHRVQSDAVHRDPSSKPPTRPCDKHPPEYFARLLHQQVDDNDDLEKTNNKAKLNQLWPRHWGCKTILTITLLFQIPRHL